jgi:integrase
MPKIVPTLTIAAVRELAGTDGTFPVSPRLYMQVQNGNASMIFRYKSPATGKGRSMGLGAFMPSAGTLDEQRAKVAALAAKVKAGIDPLEEATQEKKERVAGRARQEAQAVTFSGAVDAFMKAHSAKWTDNHATAFRNTLDRFAAPVLGKLACADITTDHVEKVLTPIWATKTTTANRLRNRIEIVLDFAKAKKWRTGDNPAVWKGAFKHLLPAPADIHEVTHFRALPADQVPALMAALAVRNFVRSRALEFLTLTAARSGTVRGMTWAEVTGDTWAVPGNRMKNGKQWRTPLSKQALAVLTLIKQPGALATDYVFPGRIAGQPMSHDSLQKELKACGCTATAHGQRSAFKGWSIGLYDYTISEFQLAHVEGSETAQSYDRDDRLSVRTPMLAQWGEWCRPTVAAAGI